MEVKYCPKCGFRVDDFYFCPACGYDLRRRARAATPPPNPLVAAILNFIFLGAGYIYMRKRLKLGFGLLFVFLLSLLGVAAMQLKSTDVGLLILVVADTILSLSLAIDAYETAKLG